MQTLTRFLPPIYVTHENFEQLARLVDAASLGPRADVAARLDFELGRAELVDARDIAPDVVTMGSKVIFEDVDARKWREVELVYPHQSDSELARISVFAPVGMALLGLPQGEAIHWPLPAAGARTLKVVRVVYQPEAAAGLSGLRRAAPAP